MIRFIILFVWVFTTFPCSAGANECDTSKPGHVHCPQPPPKETNGSLPFIIGGAIVVVGGIATYYFMTREETEGSSMALDESQKWIDEHVVNDEQGTSFKVFQW